MITRRFRDAYLRNGNIYLAALYGYWGTWMMHSIYNYVSFKPMVVTFLVLCAIGYRHRLLVKILVPPQHRTPATPEARSVTSVG